MDLFECVHFIQSVIVKSITDPPLATWQSPVNIRRQFDFSCSAVNISHPKIFLKPVFLLT